MEWIRCPVQPSDHGWQTADLVVTDTPGGVHVGGVLVSPDGRERWPQDVDLPWPPPPAPDTWDEWWLMVEPPADGPAWVLTTDTRPYRTWMVVAKGWRVTGQPVHDSGHIIDNIADEVGYIFPRRPLRPDEPVLHVGVHAHGAIDTYDVRTRRTQRIVPARRPETLTRLAPGRRTR
jgi:hypothetical protein